MRRSRKRFPYQPKINRFYFPLTERGTVIGSGNVGTAEPYTQCDNSLFENTDPLGSYTGVPADGGKPIQDADDL